MLSEIVRELQKSRDDNIPHMNTINALSDKVVNEEKLTSSNRVSVTRAGLKGGYRAPSALDPTLTVGDVRREGGPSQCFLRDT